MPNNNNEAFSVIRQLYAQKTGQSDIANVSLENIIATATEWDNTQKEQFLNTLSNAYMETKYLDTAYRDRYNDVFYEDSAMFGAITRVISVEMPQVIENRSWVAITSGTTTIGSNVVYLPIVNEQLYATSVSWGVPLAFTGTMANSAFSSVQGLMEFDNYIRLSGQNAVTAHRQLMNGTNRNNYMGQKLSLLATQGNKKHVVNVVEEYCKQYNLPSMTASAFFQSGDALRHMVKTFKKYKSLMLDNTNLFTTADNANGKFTAPERFVFQILSDVEGLLESQVYSSVYHTEFVELPMYRDVASWQGLTSEDASTNFEELSSINITTAQGDDVAVSGVIALMVDKWAIMHTNIQNRVGYQYDGIKDITLNDYQFTDKYINNTTLNGVVFVAQNYTAAA